MTPGNNKTKNRAREREKLKKITKKGKKSRIIEKWFREKEKVIRKGKKVTSHGGNFTKKEILLSFQKWHTIITKNRTQFSSLPKKEISTKKFSFSGTDLFFHIRNGYSRSGGRIERSPRTDFAECGNHSTRSSKVLCG